MAQETQTRVVERARALAETARTAPRRSPAGTKDGALGLARSLGWFSIALGALELTSAGSLARALGLRRSADLLRLFGLREIGTGMLILASEDPTPWIWGRVAGDVLDIGTVLGGVRRNSAGAALGLAALAGATALDIVCARRLSAR